jgi:hypothetical protein
MWEAIMACAYAQLSSDPGKRGIPEVVISWVVKMAPTGREI